MRVAWVSELLPVLDGIMGGVLLLMPLGMLDDILHPGPHRLLAAAIFVSLLITALFVTYCDALSIRFRTRWMRIAGRGIGCSFILICVVAALFAPNLH
jgi:UDP-N-acetylmuramyl pentapeptide phosphotransferase/UDP-N-acetylglucosamine-1-phosphate transferase